VAVIADDDLQSIEELTLDQMRHKYARWSARDRREGRGVEGLVLATLGKAVRTRICSSRTFGRAFKDERRVSQHGGWDGMGMPFGIFWTFDGWVDGWRDDIPGVHRMIADVSEGKRREYLGLVQ
jgi:hypothetical protein